MTTLIATSVVRGSRQGESHGGVYLLDLEQEKAALAIDWNTADIDWQGRGWDRGLRGISFDDEGFLLQPVMSCLNTPPALNTSPHTDHPFSSTVTK